MPRGFIGFQSPVSAGVMNFLKGAPVQVSAVVDLNAVQGNVIHLAGTGTITQFLLAAGAVRWVIVDSTPTITYNSTSLIVPSKVNISCAAGDTFGIVGDGNGNVIVFEYNKADGTAVVAASAGLSGVLQTVTASTSATVNVDTTFDATYDAYLIVVTALTVDTDTAGINGRLKIGGSYISTNTYKDHSAVSNSGAATYAGISGTADTSMQIFTDVGSAAAKSANLTVCVFNPTSTTQSKLVNWHGSCINGAGNMALGYGGGLNTGTAALTGVQFFATSGNILAGKFRLYGYKNT